MLSGKRAFRGDSMRTMSAILREDPTDLSRRTKQYRRLEGLHHCSKDRRRFIPLATWRCLEALFPFIVISTQRSPHERSAERRRSLAFDVEATQ